MQYLLALDCSGKTLSLAVFQSDQLIAEKHINNTMQHSVNLLPAIDQLLFTSGILLTELSAIAVTLGPGSYTGIRIGIATANSLAFSLNVPVIGVSSLAALVQPFNRGNSYLLPSFDARGGRVFAALYQNGQCLAGDRQYVGQQLPEFLQEKVEKGADFLLLGDGREVVRDLLSGAGFSDIKDISELPEDHFIKASAVGELALTLLHNADFDLQAGYQKPVLPNYCALSQAERNRRDKKQ